MCKHDILYWKSYWKFISIRIRYYKCMIWHLPKDSPTLYQKSFFPCNMVDVISHEHQSPGHPWRVWGSPPHLWRVPRPKHRLCRGQQGELEVQSKPKKSTTKSWENIYNFSKLTKMLCNVHHFWTKTYGLWLLLLLLLLLWLFVVVRCFRPRLRRPQLLRRSWCSPAPSMWVASLVRPSGFDDRTVVYPIIFQSWKQFLWFVIYIYIYVQSWTCWYPSICLFIMMV